MGDRILFVDDEPNVLAAFRRQFHGGYDVATACGGEEGVAAVRGSEPFAVIVSDMRMPGMDGAQFLGRIRELAPDSVRVLLTGYADQRSAVAAVNEGNIFRFLTKPCPPEVLTKALEACVRQYRLIRAEKELLEQTLRGSIRVLTEVLSLVNPLAFGRASRVQRLVKAVAKLLGVEDAWQLEVAAMLSQLGCVTVPEALLGKVYHEEKLSPDEARVFEGHPRVGADLLRSIPRMEAVAEIIGCQEKRFDGSGSPPDGRRGQDIPLGARVLKAVLDFDTLESRDHCPARALECLRQRSGWYDPAVLDALERFPWEDTGYDTRALRACDLRPGMLLAEDLLGSNGVLLMRKSQPITEASLCRLQNLAWKGTIPEPIKVHVPPQSAASN